MTPSPADLEPGTLQALRHPLVVALLPGLAAPVEGHDACAGAAALGPEPGGSAGGAWRGELKWFEVNRSGG